MILFYVLLCLHTHTPIHRNANASTHTWVCVCALIVFAFNWFFFSFPWRIYLDCFMLHAGRWLPVAKCCLLLQRCHYYFYFSFIFFLFVLFSSLCFCKAITIFVFTYVSNWRLNLIKLKSHHACAWAGLYGDIYYL